ncbi:MAG: DUF4340 domain-containing protein [Polyangiaceae bacterium]
MQTDHKIYVALAVLIALGGAVYATQQKKQEDEQRITAGVSSANLPDLKLPGEDADKITKIEIKQPEKKIDVTLAKGDDGKWKLTSPVSYAANENFVKSLINNVKELKAKDQIDKSSSSYAEYNLSDDKAVHVVLYKGGDKAIDLYFGKSGSRGQTARKAGVDGVFAVTGYTSSVFTREVKQWRDGEILKFDDAAVTQLEIKNTNGELSFKKEGEAWTSSAAVLKGDKLEKAEKIERFDEAKVKDMLRTFKNLNAEDYADGKGDADLGLDKPTSTITITLKEGAPIKLLVGKTVNEKGENRFLKKDGNPQGFVLSSFAAGWAMAKADKFQKPEEKKKDDKDAGVGDAGAPKKEEKKLSSRCVALRPPRRVKLAQRRSLNDVVQKCRSVTSGQWRHGCWCLRLPRLASCLHSLLDDLLELLSFFGAHSLNVVQRGSVAGWLRRRRGVPLPGLLWSGFFLSCVGLVGGALRGRRGGVLCRNEEHEPGDNKERAASEGEPEWSLWLGW